ncbi:MAG: AAA family ATPase [Oleiphilaceae bacterium]|nr:AAA family ATPase [Oleiphilaceae bacterium]
MRILSIRFKNLNSLAGEWEIDLTHPAYTSDGIFAITGPTGAGKSTLLDAICLALYGRTPRLDKVTKSGNEIMSRQTGECYAEVTFETAGGRYVCHWSQRRARKKPEGELQVPKHEFADADTGQVLESQIRTVAVKVEETTGMDFDRFTRSMLLAQGGFAAFLQANPDDRAPILEQITGTEIYSEISKLVHERRGEEKQTLDKLRAAMAGIQLLSDEDEQSLSASLETNLAEEAELGERIASHNTAIKWLEGLHTLEQRLETTSQRETRWQARSDAFEPEQLNLQRANQALEITGDYSALQSLRSAQSRNREALINSQAELPVLKESQRQAKLAMEAAEQKRVHCKEQYQAILPGILKTRELDLRIQTLEKAMAEQGSNLRSREEALTRHRDKQAETKADQSVARKDYRELLAAIEKTRSDEELVGQLEGLRSRFHAIRQAKQLAENKQQEARENAAGMLAADRLWQQQKQALEICRNVSREKQAQLDTQQQAAGALLGGTPLPSWRNRLLHLNEHQATLAAASEKKEFAVQLDAERRALFDKQETAKAELQTTELDLQKQSESQQALQREQDLLQTQLTLLTKIQSLEQAREELAYGQECPLCGSTDHPFAEGGTPQMGDTEKALVEQKRKVAAASAEVTGLQARAAGLRSTLEHLAESQRDLDPKIAGNTLALSRLCEQLSLDPGSPDLSQILIKQVNDIKARITETRATIEQVEVLEQSRENTKQALEEARTRERNAEGQFQSAAHKKETTENLALRLKGEEQEANAQLVKLFEQTRKDLRQLGLEVASPNELTEAEQELYLRRERWLVRQQDKAELDQGLARLEIELRHLAEKIEEDETQLKSVKTALSKNREDRDELHRERQAVLGDKDPDEEERQQVAAIASAEKAVEAARVYLTSQTEACQRLDTRITELSKSMTEREPELNAAEQRFHIQLREQALYTEEQFTAAALPEEARRNLARQAQTLSDEKAALDASRKEIESNLIEERARKVTEEPLDQLRENLGLLVETQRKLSEAIGSQRQKLQENENARKTRSEQAEAMEAQQTELNRWNQLHELIGSSDGKKFRNFAQGLTFEMMVGHANRQLRNMTDRYLLVRDKTLPLDLNVVDNYQAGETRSTKNLSGGESFIVSLALALGLSSMASKNVRVDSLFLDEGFGTLDEDSLDTALETLSNLQQEGKLIGVISHVTTLKERISTQIQITPDNGGRSRISGPGCERLYSG